MKADESRTRRRRFLRTSWKSEKNVGRRKTSKTETDVLVFAVVDVDVDVVVVVVVVVVIVVVVVAVAEALKSNLLERSSFDFANRPVIIIIIKMILQSHF